MLHHLQPWRHWRAPHLRPSSTRPRWPSWGTSNMNRWGLQGIPAAPDVPLHRPWDHRVIDGAAAARFNAYLGQILADFRRAAWKGRPDYGSH